MDAETGALTIALDNVSCFALRSADGVLTGAPPLFCVDAVVTQQDGMMAAFSPKGWQRTSLDLGTWGEQPPDPASLKLVFNWPGSGRPEGFEAEVLQVKAPVEAPAPPETGPMAQPMHLPPNRGTSTSRRGPLATVWMLVAAAVALVAAILALAVSRHRNHEHG
jgi:hypothetical protein